MATNPYGDAEDLENAGIFDAELNEEAAAAGQPGAKSNPFLTPAPTGQIFSSAIGQKYIEDQIGRELDDNARVWRVYNDESLLYDRNMVYVHRETIDILLVFAGLFSAVVVTVLVEVTQRMEPDYTEFNTRLLTELVNQGRVASGLPPFSVKDLDLPDDFAPEFLDTIICGLWFMSLVMSLFVSMFCVVIKQWLSNYLSPISASPAGKATTRQLRFEGLHKWKVPFIIGMLPQFLTMSVMLFFIGLVIFLWTLNKAIAYSIASMACFTVVMYITSAVIPIFKMSCPYKTSLTALVYRILFARTRVDISQVEVDMVNEESKARETRAQCLYWLYDNTQIPAVNDLVMESLSGLYVQPTDKEQAQKWDLTDDHKEYERVLYKRLRNKRLFAIELMEYIEAWWWALPWEDSEEFRSALDKEKIERVTRTALYLIQGGDHWKEMYQKLKPVSKSAKIKHSSWPLRGVHPRMVKERTQREDEFEAFFRDKVLPTFQKWAKRFAVDDIELKHKLVEMDYRLDPQREQWARRMKEEEERKERLRQLEAAQRMIEAQQQLAEAEIKEKIRSATSTSRATSLYNTPNSPRSQEFLNDSNSTAPGMIVQAPSTASGAPSFTTSPLLLTPTSTSHSDAHSRQTRRSRSSSYNLTIPSRSGINRTPSKTSQPSMGSLFVARDTHDDVEKNAGLRGG